MCRELQREEKAPEGWDQPDGWKAKWPKIVEQAYNRRLNLSAQAHYQSPRLTGYDFDGKPGNPFLYFTYSAAVRKSRSTRSPASSTCAAPTSFTTLAVALTR